jgi:predicted peptidase
MSWRLPSLVFSIHCFISPLAQAEDKPDGNDITIGARAQAPPDSRLQFPAITVDKLHMPRKLTAAEAQVLAARNWALHYFRIDADRVYLAGFSMGGVATKRMGVTYPDLFAALNSRSGPIIRKNHQELYRNLHDLPLYALGGGRDELNPVETFQWEREKCEAEKLPCKMVLSPSWGT